MYTICVIYIELIYYIVTVNNITYYIFTINKLVKPRFEYDLRYNNLSELRATDPLGLTHVFNPMHSAS